MMPVAQTYGTLPVSRIAGVTPRQLQWWAETGIIDPPQVKHARQYSASDLFHVHVVSELSQRGFSLSAARKACLELAKHPVAHRWMITNGRDVRFLSGEDELIAFLEQRRVPIYTVVNLDKLRAKMERRIAECAPVVRRPAQRAMEFAGMIREALRA